jgi:hypothetical protein
MILIRFKGLSDSPDSQSHSDTPMHGAGSMQYDPTLSLLMAWLYQKSFLKPSVPLPDADGFGNRKNTGKNKASHGFEFKW